MQNESVFACARVLMAVAFVAIGGYSAQAGLGRNEAAAISGVAHTATGAVIMEGAGSYYDRRPDLFRFPSTSKRTMEPAK